MIKKVVRRSGLSLLIATLFIASKGVANENLFVSSLEKEPMFNIVRSKKKSELESFASWFHQDWKMIFRNFDEGSQEYLSSLDSSRKSLLKEQLNIFLQKNKDLKDKSLMREWIGLGAQGWDANLPLYETLQSFAESITPNK